MNKIKELFSDFIYNYIYMNITVLFLIWGTGIVLIWFSYLNYGTYTKLEKFIEQNEFTYVSGCLDNIVYHKSKGGQGQAASYVKITFDDGQEFYHMPSLFERYDWDKLLFNLHQQDHIELQVYKFNNDSRGIKFVSVTDNGRQLLTLEETKEICKTRYQTMMPTIIKQLVVGIIICFVAVGSTILRKI